MSEVENEEVQSRQVEVTEETGIRDGRDLLAVGDRVTRPKDKADLWISLGWAKCVATGEQGERREGVQTLDVHPAIQES